MKNDNETVKSFSLIYELAMDIIDRSKNLASINSDLQNNTDIANAGELRAFCEKFAGVIEAMSETAFQITDETLPYIFFQIRRQKHERLFRY